MKKIYRRILLSALAALSLFINCCNGLAVERVYILPSTTREKAPKSNVFQLKGTGDKFILLDHTEDGYFVLSLKYCTLRSFSLDGNPVAFDPEDKNSIAYWLNNDYINDLSVQNRLPQIIIDNLVERVYTTEGGGSMVSFSSDYDVKCKIVLLSQTEWSKYNGKFGYADDGSSSFWFLRSVRGLTGAPLVAAVSSSNAGLTVEGKWSSVIGIRPAFCLADDFFDKATVDIENTGDAVMSIIRQRSDLSEVKQLYSGNELKILTESDIAPAADAVTITGRGIVGEKIVGKYNFVSLDGNGEDGTTIQWLKSRDGEVWSTILGADKTEYTPTASDVGCYIKMKVSPMTASMAGASYESIPLKCKIREISEPVAADVRTENASFAKPGDRVSVKYSYYDENRDLCSETEYVWESSADKLQTEKIGDTRYYKLKNSDGGKFVRAGVIPKKKTNSTDGRKTVAGDISYSDWFFVENLPVAADVKIVRNMDASVTVSKTADGISISNILKPVKINGIERLTAQYSIDKNDDYEIVCRWQGSSLKYGVYGNIKSGTDVLDYAPEGTVWVRAKVYAKNSEGIGNAVYSEPICIAGNEASYKTGESILTKKLSSGKTYELWIVNGTVNNSYAYSFRYSSLHNINFSSEKYLTHKFEQTNGTYIIGTLVSDIYSNDFCFKAGEITAQGDDTLTISDVLTASVGDDGNTAPCLSAKVYIVEK